jgi:ParB family chromosome partitioning protein
MEEARAYRSLMEAFNLTQDDVSKKVGKQRSTVANALRLLKLPVEMQEAIDRGNLTAGHARAILSVTLADGQKVLFQQIIAEGLSVREAEDRAQKLNAGSPPAVARVSAPAPVRRLPDLADLEQRFIERLGTKVSIKGDAKKGKIEIAYHSSDDLDRLYEILGGGEG